MCFGSNGIFDGCYACTRSKCKSFNTGFAASATKKLKSGDVTVELDKSCAATNVSVDIKTAAEGLHDFTDDPYVHNYLD